MIGHHSNIELFTLKSNKHYIIYFYYMVECRDFKKYLILRGQIASMLNEIDIKRFIKFN